MRKIKCLGVMFAMTNGKKSKQLYETILQQKLVGESDGSTFLDFEDIFGLHEGFDKFVGGESGYHPPIDVKLDKSKPNNFQLYFETNDLDNLVETLKSTDGIEMIHDIVEYSYGQRVSRFYDYDKNIFEISESFECAAKRLLAQGLTVDEIAERFGDSVESVQQLLRTK